LEEANNKLYISDCLLLSHNLMLGEVNLMLSSILMFLMLREGIRKNGRNI